MTRPPPSDAGDSVLKEGRKGSLPVSQVAFRLCFCFSFYPLGCFSTWLSGASGEMPACPEMQELGDGILGVNSEAGRVQGRFTSAFPIGPHCRLLAKVHVCRLLSSFVGLKINWLAGWARLWSLPAPKPQMVCDAITFLTSTSGGWHSKDLLRARHYAKYFTYSLSKFTNRWDCKSHFSDGKLRIENPSTSKCRLWDLNTWAPPPAHLTSVLGFYGQSYEVLTTLWSQRNFVVIIYYTLWHISCHEISVLELLV